ncbi:heavy metal translocating P-type ATPase [Sphaerimonospora sp. CA-214678]|uniref:heavy metal translocating P-type ATPase n=1 Tax=Sphaerimonospora sp. CA-214678 TaxID=3240029 RepID=UPI003D9189CD
MSDHQHDRHSSHPDEAPQTHGVRHREHDTAEHEHSGHHEGHHGGGHEGHAAVFRDRFRLSLLLTVPVVFYSHHLQDWLGYSAPAFPGSSLVAPVLGTVVFFYGGWPFLTGAMEEARERRPGMMLLIGMAIAVAFGASLTASLGWFDVEVWWELCLLITIMLLGHWMEMRAVGQAQGALAALAELLPDEAERVTGDGEVERVCIGDLAVGDVVLVRPGGRVPADGVIVQGAGEVDESMITGESKPVPREAGGRVVAASVVVGGSLRVRVDALGEDTTLAGIQRLVAQAQESRSHTQVLADRAAALLFYLAVIAGVITVATWALLGQPDAALTRSVTVLIIACPHALGLAIPLVTSIATAKSARNGVLVKDRLALERMRSVNAVLFDKTGTLTKGEHALTGMVSVDGDDDHWLALAAAVEADSEHPLARAVVAAARETGVEVPDASGFQSMAGRGVRARVGGAGVAVGGPALLREQELKIPEAMRDRIAEWRSRGASVLYVVAEGKVSAALTVEDQIRDESRAAIQELHRLGVRVAMITGDARQVADAVAADLGIDEVFAEVLPEDKDAAVTDLQQRGYTVAMVGDGVNDAPALARADVGIAIGAGTDVAIESAGIVLASDDPRAVVAVRRLSQASYRKMLQNLWWAAGYNILAIPLAAGVFASVGFVLPMAVGAVLMSLSTIIVAINAQFLRRIDLQPQAVPAG